MTDNDIKEILLIVDQIAGAGRYHIVNFDDELDLRELLIQKLKEIQQRISKEQQFKLNLRFNLN